MADSVLSIMEAMLPELSDLQTSGVLSPEEVTAVVAARRGAEYALAKRVPVADDYVRAIEYELAFEGVRRRRKERLGLKAPRVADFAGIRRIHFIFDRATRRLRSPSEGPRWWLAWADFAARCGSSKALDRIYGKALTLYPRCAALWLAAAVYQFDVVGGYGTARALCSRALRVNPTHLGLWVAYFQMECVFALRAAGRAVAAGEVVSFFMAKRMGR